MRVLTLMFFLLSGSLWARQIDNLLKYDGKKDVELNLTFSDGYEQKIRGPIKIKLDKVRSVSRCGCTFYDISFYDEKGNLQKRTIESEAFGPDIIKWTGADGTPYKVSAVDLSNGKEEPKKEEDKPTCRLAGKMKRVKIIPEKVMHNEGSSCPKNAVMSCMGDAIVKCEAIMECQDDPTYGTNDYELFCMSKNSGACPTMQECVADTAYEEFDKESKEAGFKLRVEDIKTKGI